MAPPIVIAVCALIIESGPVRATEHSVRVIEPDFSGAFEQGGEQRLRQRLDAGVRRSDAKLTSEDSDYEVHAKIAKRDRDYEFVLELHDTSGQAISTARRVCEICGEAEAGDMLEATATRIASQVAGAAAPSELSVQTNPSGAKVVVDGEHVGKTPIELRLPAGRHELSITRPNFSSASRTVVLEPGVRTHTEFELLAVPKRRKLRPWGYVALAVGVPTMAAGIGLLYYDGRPHRRRCAGADVDGDGDCRFVYRFKAGGTVAVAAGVALVSAGVAMLVVAHKRRGERGSSKRAALSGRGAHLRWRGPWPAVRF